MTAFLLLLALSTSPEPIKAPRGVCPCPSECRCSDILCGCMFSSGQTCTEGCECNNELAWRWYDDGDTSQVALMRGSVQIGAYRFKDDLYRPYDRAKDSWGDSCKPPLKPPQQRSSEAVDAPEEVNAARARRGLRPFLRDDGLTQAAQACAAYRAKRLIQGHSQNDFDFVPSGSTASAAGCAAWEPSLGWGACCTYEGYTYAGAAWVMGSDNKRYMHLYVR